MFLGEGRRGSVLPRSYKGRARDLLQLGEMKGHGFIGYPKGRKSTGTELPLCFVYFSLTGTVSTSPNLGTVSTSPNLAKARARRASNDCRATRSLFS